MGYNFLPYKLSDLDLFDWAYMNVCTRCFGTHHLPSSISMAPLMDMLNHTNNEKLKYKLLPYELHRQMIQRGLDIMTNDSLKDDGKDRKPVQRVRVRENLDDDLHDDSWEGDGSSNYYQTEEEET